MGRFRFSIRVPICEPAASVGTFIRQVEEAGFDGAWLTDSQLLWRDVWVSLAVAALATSSIRLGTGVTNPITRHGSVTASAAGTVQELSGGRFALGAGTGASSVESIGLEPARTGEMRAFLQRLRALVDGTEVDLGGRQAQLQFVAPQRVPIYLAVRGPRMMELGGELADGLLLDVPATTDSLMTALDHVDRGARRAGRRVEDLDCVVVMFGPSGETGDDLRVRARPFAALDAVRAGHPRAPGALATKDLLRLSHEPDLGRIEHATAWLPDEHVDEFLAARSLPASERAIVPIVARLRDQGIGEIYLRAFDPHTLPRRLCALGASLIPAMRDAVDG